MRRLRWPEAWPRDVAVDVAAALLLSAGAVSDASRLAVGADARWAAAVPALCCTLVVATRRLAPASSSIVSLLAAASYELTTHDQRFTYEPYAVLIVVYMLGRTERPQNALRHRLALAAAAPAFAVIAIGSHQSVATWLPAFFFFAVVPYGAGLLLARRARDTDVLESRIAVLLGERELQERSAAHQERMRVARELHDVAAHCLTEMVIHAGGARIVAGRDATVADEALETAAESGRAAVTELQRLAAGTSDRDETSRFLGLVASLRDTPVSVTTAWPDPAPPLPVWADLVAYRLLQEALTNAARHASGARVTVDVSLSRESLDLTVVNDPGSGWHRPSGGGYGLVGMRERVASLGGEIETGATAEGGYAVRARLPLVPRPSSVPPEPDRTSRRIRQERIWDAVVPAAWLVLLLAEALTSDHRSGPVWFNALVVSIMATAAVLRRRSPLTYLVVVSVLSSLLGSGLSSRDYATLTGLYTVIMPSYAVGSWSPPRRASVAMAVWAVAATITGLAQHATGSGLIGPLMAAAASAGIGAVVQSQRRLGERLALTEHAVLEQTRTLQRLAVERERRRLAEVHHATVARQVEDLVSDLEAARRLLDDDDARFGHAVIAIENGGREALARMREVLGALRSGATAGPGAGADHQAVPALEKAISA